MIEVCVVNPANKKPLKINGEGEISVTMHSHPPIDEIVESYPFSSWFENAGSNDMRVDGSSAPVLFSIGAGTRDRFIKTISVRISDTGATLDKFGALAALTNGIKFIYENPKIGEVTIQDEIDTNLSFLRLGFSTAGVGDGTSAFKSDISGGGADTYLPVIDLKQTFGFPWGLHIPRNSTSKIGFYVNDNLSVGIDTFNIKAFGIEV